jgi:uncharacterized membrane protein
MVLPIVTAGLYLLGLTYYQGYLEGFGIEETLFPLSVDRTIFQGFVVFITLGAKPFSYLFIAAIAVFSTAILAALISSNQRIRGWGKLLTSRLRQPSSVAPLSKNAYQWIDKAGIVFIYVTVAFLIYLALLIVALTATQSGKEQASNFIENAKKTREGFVTLNFTNNATPITAKPILCSASHCAYWLGNQAVLYKNESVEKIVTYNMPLHKTSK